jgi:putative transposase
MGRPDVAPAPDLVDRDFSPSGPDQVWAADVTQFRTGEGWLHLAGVIDLWSRRVVGWSMGTSPNSELVTDALVMTFERRRPDRRVVHHSDRGVAYTSLAFSQRVAALELDQSFGSTGDCYDNAVVEAFWATLKRELAWIHGTTTWTTRAELRSAVFDYIEGFYDPNRIRRRLGHHTPSTTKNTQLLENPCPRKRVNSRAAYVRRIGRSVRCVCLIPQVDTGAKPSHSATRDAESSGGTPGSVPLVETMA